MFLDMLWLKTMIDTITRNFCSYITIFGVPVYLSGTLEAHHTNIEYCKVVAWPSRTKIMRQIVELCILCLLNSKASCLCESIL